MLTPNIEKKWLLHVNGLFMSGHYTYSAAVKEAKRFTTGLIEIKTILTKGAN